MTITVEVQIPSDRDFPPDPKEIGPQLRVLWAIEQVRLRRCGVGKGAELAGVPRAAFMHLLGDHGIPAIDYPVEDFREELSTLDQP